MNKITIKINKTEFDIEGDLIYIKRQVENSKLKKQFLEIKNSKGHTEFINPDLITSIEYDGVYVAPQIQMPELPKPEIATYTKEQLKEQPMLAFMGGRQLEEEKKPNDPKS